MKKYHFYCIGGLYGRYTTPENPGGDNVLIGGGEYESDDEALKQANIYADGFKKTLSLVTCETDGKRIVWSLKK